MRTSKRARSALK